MGQIRDMSFLCYNSPVTKYSKIHQELRDGIVKGLFPEGSLLPTEAELMDTYGVSRTTVRTAISMLVKDGLVESRQGKGTVVSSRNAVRSDYSYLPQRKLTTISSRVKGTGDVSSSTPGMVDLSEAPPEAAMALGIEPGTPVYRIQRLKYIDSSPMAYVVSYIPQEWTPGLEKHSGKVMWLYKILYSEYGLTIERTQDVIGAENADFVTSHVLDIHVGTAILVTRRIAYSGSVPVEYSENKIAGNHMEYVVTNNILAPDVFPEGDQR